MLCLLFFEKKKKLLIFYIKDIKNLNFLKILYLMLPKFNLFLNLIKFIKNFPFLIKNFIKKIFQF